MAVTKTIEVDGKEVQFRASAAIPRLYRNKFHRDIYKDLNELQKGIDESDAESSNLDTFSLELFENIAWLMAKHQDLKKTSSDRAGNDNPALFTPVCADRAFHLGARPAHYRDCQ